MEKTTVYLPDDLLNSLENRTRRDDIKKSQVVQRALRNYFEQNVDVFFAITAMKDRCLRVLESG
jgi:metal-responsive CopG/Arc/MetJ family transcriptional regulator